MYNKGTAGTRSVVFAFFLNENISKKKATSMCCYPLKLYSLNQRTTDNIMTKIKRAKGQTTIYKTYT
jgi:hypothetical protein